MDEAGKVLIVDDDAMTVKLCTMALKRDEYETRSAADGRQGLEAALEWKPDVVLLDVMMPKLDGYEVCQQLRADERTRSTPIIMITVKDESKDVARGLDAGADDYVKKPFSTRELVARVRAAVRRKRSQDALWAAMRKSFVPFAEPAEAEPSPPPAEVSRRELAGYLHNMALCIAAYTEASVPVDEGAWLQAAMRNIGELSRHIEETTAALVEGGIPRLLRRDMLDITKPLNEAISLVKPSMEPLGVTIEPWAADQVMIVHGDRERITDVFVTLMMNAKRTALGSGAGRLVLGVTASAGQCCVALHGVPSDPGSGDLSHNPEYGMGFAREIIEAHGGSIVREQAPGEPIRYKVTLPIASA